MAANLSDQVETLARVVVRMHQEGGRAAQLRQRAGLSASQLGKLAGVSAEVVYAWERRELEPSCRQALAWLGALYPGTGPAPEPVRRAESPSNAELAADAREVLGV
jgi:transcriptional regulator with XRE-family HTH domain